MADEFTKAALYGIRTFNKKVKEKIGIEKLIELLNEFEEYNKNCEFDEVYNYYPYRVWYEGDFETDLTENCMNIVFIMSKSYGFIKWLVENDKIDYEKAREGENSDSRWHFETCQPEYFMIMLLSVQDNPIDFLISILK